MGEATHHAISFKNESGLGPPGPVTRGRWCGIPEKGKSQSSQRRESIGGVWPCFCAAASCLMTSTFAFAFLTSLDHEILLEKAFVRCFSQHLVSCSRPVCKCSSWRSNRFGQGDDARFPQASLSDGMRLHHYGSFQNVCSRRLQQ
jgi:hypothetical protein